MNDRRREWWAKLPPSERANREMIYELKGIVKLRKHDASLPEKIIYRDVDLRNANKTNTVIRALKHELDNKRAVEVKLNRSGFYCDNCHQFVQKFDNYCPVCGKKLDWTVAKEQYEQHHLLEMAEGFLSSIKSSKTTNQKLYHLDRATEMLNALKAEYEKKVKKNADKERE